MRTQQELTRSTAGSSIRHRFIRSCAAVWFLVAGLTAAQGLLLGVTAEFPGVGSLTVTPAELHFDLSQEFYPPAQFPAHYLPSSTDEQWDRVIILSVTASTTNWSLDVEFAGLINSSDNVELLVEQLEYRVDELGEWLPFKAGPNRLLASLGGDIDLAPEDHRFAVRLRVTGQETPGTYEGQLLFTLITDGF